VKLTGLSKAFIALIIIGVVGYTGYHHYGDRIKEWSKGEQGSSTSSGTPGGASSAAAVAGSDTTKDDFKNLGKPGEPDRNAGVSGVTAAAVGDGRITRPLVVGINTWAGHTPGIVANGGLDPGSPNALYKKQYGLDVKFVLIEDPQAKLTAFIKGDIDVMWDTVDSWAREASTLAEQKIPAKAIIQQDWSRGGDGIVSLNTIKSIEDLKGKTIATTRYTPSHWLLLYMLTQSGLTVEDRKQIEKNLVFTAVAPLAAAAF
jgi:ABC-type amino acid transport substrate-binding protein